MSLNDRRQSSPQRMSKGRKALLKAFAEMLANTPMHKISVQELCGRADIHRSTFYIHYKDVYDLFEHIQEDAIKAVNDLLVTENVFSYSAVCRHVINYLRDNGTISGILFSPNANGYLFREYLASTFERYYRKQCVCAKSGISFNLRTQYIIYSQTRGAVSVIGRWINNGYDLKKDEFLSVLSDSSENSERMVIA